MSRKTRNIAFLVLAAIFLTAAPAAVMYSLGWRIDWIGRRIVEPGMLYFKASPKSAEVYIDGKLQKKTDIFFGSLLIENLMPKSYQVEIKKAGYHPWKKLLPVEKRQVTEAKNILLVPENLNISQISQNSEALFLLPNKRGFIAKETTFSANSKNQTVQKWNLKLIDASNNLKSHIMSQDDLRLGSSVDFFDLKFSSDSKSAVLRVISKEQMYYYVLNLQTNILTPIPFKTDPDNVVFNPSSVNKLFVIENGKITEMDVKSKEISSPLLSNLIAIDASNNDIYVLDETGFVYKTNPSFSNLQKLNILPFEVKKETGYALSYKGGEVFLNEGNSLYILNEDTMTFEKVSDNVKEFEVSPDGKQLLYFTDKEASILFLDKKIDQPRREKGERMLLIKSSDPIGNAFWINNFYIVLNQGKKIEIIETDDRSDLNIAPVVELDNPQITWASNKLYILSNQTLYTTSSLLP